MFHYITVNFVLEIPEIENSRIDFWFDDQKEQMHDNSINNYLANGTSDQYLASLILKYFFVNEIILQLSLDE